jgi:hypothetical protein
MPRKFPVAGLPSESSNISYNVQEHVNHITGTQLVIGDTVFMSDDGVDVLASSDGNYNAVNAYSFVDEDGDEIAGMYARDDSGQNTCGFRVVDEAGKGDDTMLEIASTSGASASAKCRLQTNRDSESTDTYLSLERGTGTSEVDIMTEASAGRVRIKPRINLLGASNEIVDIYIKGTNFILKYNDGGTIRYKYLDLSGTGTTWSHSPTEP